MNGHAEEADDGVLANEEAAPQDHRANAYANANAIGDDCADGGSANGDSNDECSCESTATSSRTERSRRAQQQRGRCYRGCARIGLGCLCRLPETWPRTFGILLGVVCPLFLLIAVSLLFGYFLARFEAPGEMDSNNNILATSFGVSLAQEMMGNATLKLPHICSTVYMLEQTLGVGLLPTVNCTNSSSSKADCTTTPSLAAQMIEDAIEKVFIRRYQYAADHMSFENVTDTTVNTNAKKRNSSIARDEYFTAIHLPKRMRIETEDALEFMEECGETALDITSRYRLNDAIDPGLVGESITFDWIRCQTPENTSKAEVIGGFFDYLLNPFANTSGLLPSAQEQTVMDQWKGQQQELYRKYFNDFYYGKNMSRVDARFRALELSYKQADGFEHCYMNWWAGSWFWFTIMTTVGYGNVAPVTVGGRTMVFTLGFLSILMFAAILARAGTIVTAIADDWANRLRFTWLDRSWVAALFWGVLYYTWMCLIASYYVYWEEARLENIIDYADAYWFSYISTTTVGLGDYYLQHGVIIGQDLLVWPLLFLGGFVLLSSFLTKLSEFIFNLVPRNRPTFEENLAEADAPFCPKLRRRHRHKTIHRTTHTAHNEEADGDMQKDVKEVSAIASDARNSSNLEPAQDEESTVAPSTLDPAERQRLEKHRSEIPKDYDSLRALYVKTESALAVERKRNRDIDIEHSNIAANTSFETADGWRGVIHPAS